MAIITEITAIHLEHRFGETQAYGMARGLTPARNATLILLETDAGVTGIGEAWGPGAMVAGSLEVVKPYFIGRDLYDREQIPPYIYNQRYHLGIQNTVTSCLGGINTAIYDAMGKLLGLPLYKLLGGLNTERVPAYASDGYFSNDPRNQLAEQLAGFRDQGFPGVKIKIGRGPADDVTRVACARDVLGPDVALMVDVNGNYTVDLALDSMRRIAEFDIHFYEEPLPPTDFDGYRELRRRAPIPVATGEALYTAHDFKRLIDGRGADVIQPDLTICGGIDPTREIAILARLANLRLSPHVWGAAVGLAAAIHFIAAQPPSPHTDNIPAPMLLEYDRGQCALRDALLAHPIPCIDGHLTVPTDPGLGIELDWDVVEKYRVG
ncbi:MAG: mandelate racemase/muconate lactonizing enzyme family protein [Alphaproteobacteria bacterium]|jgi:D-galactarolactone cycloisomerase|nr:mandelate racemase/muconate lactonizing enzyme family protein [Alphaproteobacteria bacterium]MDP6517262.1 mandelate racemase/muconate lactonizing enzyme family protein [Alphaproteobacteria bacterium]